MADAYHQLLDATIAHVKSLKARGVRFVPVAPETIAALQKTRSVVPERAPKSAPAASVFVTPETFVADKPKPAQAPAATTATPKISKPQQHPVESLGLPVAPAIAAGPAVALGSDAKAAAFSELRQQALACIKCAHLASSRKNVVFGVGDINARLMFIGEAPGADEDEQGEPFVGRAGELLTKIIQTMGLSRSTVYIANILKCRPDTPGQTSGNRKPSLEEMKTCIPYLHQQIDLIRPQVLVALGGTAVEGLLGKSTGIMKLRGNWQTYRGIPLMPTYHPAYVLRNQALSEKRRVWEDMLQVMEKLALPVTEKQKSFFLTKS